MDITAYDTRFPDEPRAGSPLLVLLHGRGSHEGDLVGLGPSLARGAVIVAPRAPFPGEPWGYGPGWAWYRIEPGFRVAPDTMETSLAALDAFLGHIRLELPVRVGPVILGGFSQGGTVSQAYALSRPGSVSLVLNFSGFLAEDPRTPLTPEAVSGTEFFWGHGKLDPAVPFDLARIGRARLREVGARLEARDYQIGHWIDPVELEDAARWLERGLSELEDDRSVQSG